jgi:hypothetical protein
MEALYILCLLLGTGDPELKYKSPVAAFKGCSTSIFYFDVVTMSLN